MEGQEPIYIECGEETEATVCIELKLHVSILEYDEIQMILRSKKGVGLYRYDGYDGVLLTPSQLRN